MNDTVRISTVKKGAHILCLGTCKVMFPQKSELTMEVGGWGQVSLGIFFWKSSQNSPKPVLIFWNSIPYVCIMPVYTLLKVISYHDLSVLSMSVMGFQKRNFVWALSNFIFWIFWNFFNFAKPLRDLQSNFFPQNSELTMEVGGWDQVSFGCFCKIVPN